MTTLTVTAEDFKKNVLQAEKLTIVDFWAEWCGPCKMIAPFLEEISQEMENKVQIAKVNIDENPDLAIQYGVRSIPTLLMFKEGQMIDNMVGAAPKANLLSWIKQKL